MWTVTACENRRGERGSTIAESMVVLLLTGILLATTASYSVSWLGREDLRHAASEIRTQLQAARAHAISRNRATQFRLNTTTRQIQVYDLVDPSDLTDDILLATASLPKKVTFARPDSGSTVTLPVLSGTTYQATFESNGSVSSTPGLVCLSGGERFDRVTLFAAGGVKLEKWADSAWTIGS
ncbi:MAG: GspH/FimT family pseudopilin [Candidatus Polarisedimenticolia bacterium]